MNEPAVPAARTSEDKQLAEELVERAREEGVELVGPGGLLSGLTKNVLEASLEAEMSEHLGDEKPDDEAEGADDDDERRCSGVGDPIHFHMVRVGDGPHCEHGDCDEGSHDPDGLARAY